MRTSREKGQPHRGLAAGDMHRQKGLVTSKEICGNCGQGESCGMGKLPAKTTLATDKQWVAYPSSRLAERLFG